MTSKAPTIPADGHVLILRTSNADGTSRNNFRWPESGPVECPDWQPTAECGHGLHGALWGEGAGGLFRWETDARWQVVEVAAADVIDLTGKVKFPRGVVVFSGDRMSATAYLAVHGEPNRAVIGGTATAGHSGTATAGHSGTATAGDSGTATAGDSGTATAGRSGTATAGHDGTATAGRDGTATAGRDGTATAGDWGIVELRWYDGGRDRITVGYIGEDGLLPSVAYRCDSAGEIVPAQVTA